jgi:hypothetical protein
MPSAPVGLSPIRVACGSAGSLALWPLGPHPSKPNNVIPNWFHAPARLAYSPHSRQWCATETTTVAWREVAVRLFLIVSIRRGSFGVGNSLAQLSPPECSSLYRDN